MKKYNITGMHCAVCQGRIEKVVSELDGVDNVSVSLLTNNLFFNIFFEHVRKNHNLL